jgi:glycosyltransferase involved in cell wall biosynthesis
MTEAALAGAPPVRTAAGSRMQTWRARLSFLLLAGLYGATLALCRLAPRRRPAFARRGLIAVCGTFHNPNWFRSHATPLGRSGVGEVVVVTDRAQPAVDHVRVSCPPRGLSTLVGRGGARLLWMFGLGLRRRPDLYMGYHILPNALIALWLGRLFGRPACYQMTAGPSEVAGGGYRADNRVLASLRAPWPRLERLALAVVREFDLVVVRGSGARRFLADRDVRRTAVITGSADAGRFPLAGERSIDVLSVGQLIERKRPLEFVEIVAEVAARVPGLRATLVGDGPLRAAVEGRVAERGLERSLERAGQRADVEAYAARARVFLLTSRSEGLSIAMVEAMMAGAVPVVADVGDLGDLVENGVTGYRLDPDDRAGFVRTVTSLLAEPARWAKLSAAARRAARDHSGLDHVTELWARHLEEAMRPVPGP